MISRLGDVLYWLSCIIAAGLTVFGMMGAAREPSVSNQYWVFGFFAVLAFVVWLIGRAIRYVFSAK
jgi:hypothetical protein